MGSDDCTSQKCSTLLGHAHLCLHQFLQCFQGELFVRWKHSLQDGAGPERNFFLISFAEGDEEGEQAFLLLCSSQQDGEGVELREEFEYYVFIIVGEL